MRLLRFFLIFLGVAVLVVGSIFWINRETFITVFQNREAIIEGSEWVEKTYSLAGLIEFIDEQPQHTALSSVSENKQESIFFQADRQLPAGTLSNLFLYITYANHVVNGKIIPETRVDIEKIKSFYIAGADDQHRGRLEQWTSDKANPPEIRDLITYLIRNNDPAVADYLYFLLGPRQVDEMAHLLGDGLIEPPLPQFGIRSLALQQATDSSNLTEHLEKLGNMDRDELFRKANNLAQQQWDHPDDTVEMAISSFTAQRMLYNLYPKVQPRKYADVLMDIWNGNLINSRISTTLQNLLRRSPGDRLLEGHISDYAAHFDERMSFMSGWTVARSVETDNITVQVFLFSDIPAGLWFHMNSNFMIRDFHHRMLYDENIRNRTRSILNVENSVTYNY